MNQQINYVPQMASIVERVNTPIRIVQCIQMFNEEEFAEAVLASVYDHVDQIVVIEGAVGEREDATDDGHSTDRTLEIINAFKADKDPGRKVQLISIKRPWKSLEEMKQTFLDLTSVGDWLLINDCLTGNRCVPVKIDGRITVMSLEDLFKYYVDNGYAVSDIGGKEYIHPNNLETLSVIDVKAPEHYLYRQERGEILSDWFKSRLNDNHLSKVLDFEKGSAVCMADDPKIGLTRNARNKLKTLINPVASWKKVSCITRSKTDKDIVRVSHKYGETECTVDHRIAIRSGDLEFVTAEDFDHVPQQIGELISDDVAIDTITLSDWVSDSRFVVENDKLKWDGSYHARNTPWVKNVLSGHELIDFCKMLGFYVAEGSVNKIMKDWRISQNDKSILDEIHKCLVSISDHKFNYGSTRKDNGSETFYVGITSQIIIRLFAELCGIGAENKRIPSLIFHLSPSFQEAFLEGYLLGDGHNSIVGADRSDTISPSLHGGLCLLYKQLNKTYSVYHREPDQYYDEFDHSRVFSLYHDTKLDQITSGDLRKTNLGKTSDYVYDLTVPETSNFCDADGLIVVHNCDEFYRPEDIERLRVAIDRHPHASEFIPSFLHFYRDLSHIAIPGPEWQPQHQRIIKNMGGMRYNSHPVAAMIDGHCSYFSLHMQPRRFVIPNFFVYHYGYARKNMDEIMRRKQAYYEKELAKHGGANKKFDKKVQDWFDGTEPTLFYDGDHPAVIDVERATSLPDGEIPWDNDRFYKMVLTNEQVPNAWLCMTGQAAPSLPMFSNMIDGDI